MVLTHNRGIYTSHNRGALTYGMSGEGGSTDKARSKFPHNGRVRKGTESVWIGSPSAPSPAHMHSLSNK